MAEAKGPQPSESVATGRGEAPPDATAIEGWIVGCLAEMLHVEPESIDVRRPFTYFGLSSADSVILAGDLERWLGGRRLPPTLAWDFPTIELLSRHLAAEEGGGKSASEEMTAAGEDAAQDSASEAKMPAEEETPAPSGGTRERDESR